MIRRVALLVLLAALATVLALIAHAPEPAPYDEYAPSSATPFQGEMP